MIRVADLTVVDALGRPVVDRLSLAVEAGERVGLVGESGAGKTTLALALLGALRPGLRVARGGVTVAGDDVMSLRGGALRTLRGRTVSYLNQDPASALTPTIRVRGQIAELAADRAKEAIARRLADLGLPDDHRFLRRYPHELSGGQRQRLALARATARDPRVLILDEPTTGLDALAQDLVLNQIDGLVRRGSLTLVFITHDLAAAARMCDRLVVLRAGALVEDGPAGTVLGQPSAAYTRDLVRAVPSIAEAWQAREAPDTGPTGGPSPVLRITDLSAAYREGRRRRTVVSGVSFDVAPGECVALLGPSGSGKTTVARCLTGMHRRSGGVVELDGRPVAASIRDRTVDERRRIQVVPQHSAGSLNPRRTVGAAIARPLRLLRGLDHDAAREETVRLLDLVGLPAHLAGRLPSELSGGQTQRITIARALAAEPSVLVCDEMTSSLDVRVQASVLDLLADLRAELRLGMVLITHDLGVLARTADRVLVLRDGAVCAQGPVSEVLRRPGNEWTRALILAATVLPGQPGADEREPAPGGSAAGMGDDLSTDSGGDDLSTDSGGEGPSVAVDDSTAASPADDPFAAATGNGLAAAARVPADIDALGR